MKIDSSTVSFVELRKIQDREIRIEFHGKLEDGGLGVTRKLVTSERLNSLATRKLPGPPAVPPRRSRRGRQD